MRTLVNLINDSVQISVSEYDGTYLMNAEDYNGRNHVRITTKKRISVPRTKHIIIIIP